MTDPSDRGRPWHRPVGRPKKLIPSTKVCKICAIEKPIAEFPSHGGGLWYRSKCIPCWREAARLERVRLYSENPNKYRNDQRSSVQRRKKRGGPYVPRTADEVRSAQKASHQKNKALLKEATFSAYGGAKCACCGETEPLFLSLDHINGGGNEEGRKIGKRGGWSFYAYLRAAGFPSGYQVLCYNCNIGRHLNGGICPHKLR